MLQLRKSGLKVNSEAALKASQTPDGNWVAWLEIEGVPVQCQQGKPVLFEGYTQYQAQCKAFKWYQAPRSQ